MFIEGFVLVMERIELGLKMRLTLSGAVGRLRPTCFFAVFPAFLIHFTLFSTQVFDFRLLRVHVK